MPDPYGRQQPYQPMGGEQNAFLESMAEAGKSVVDALDGNILFADYHRQDRFVSQISLILKVPEIYII